MRPPKESTILMWVGGGVISAAAIGGLYYLAQMLAAPGAPGAAESSILGPELAPSTETNSPSTLSPTSTITEVPVIAVTASDPLLPSSGGTTDIIGVTNLPDGQGVEIIVNGINLAGTTVENGEFSYPVFFGSNSTDSNQINVVTVEANYNGVIIPSNPIDVTVG